MNIASPDQWNGWFKGMGSAGVVMQNLITAITPFLFGGLAVLFVFLIIKAGTNLSKADGPEQRKEAKVKLGWLIAALVLTVVGPTIILILMNTIGKTVKTSQGGTAAAKPGLPALQNISFTIQNSNLLSIIK